MTNHWTDIKNADSILIIGSNAAEHHPISFRWVMEAKAKGATVVHVDPKFSRTSARCHHHAHLRSGTDIPFLCGMVKYILDNEKYFKEYVLEYTDAAVIVTDDYDFKDGLFSGFDAKARKYDRSKWKYALDDKKAPKLDMTLQDPRCIFQLMKQHYSRYDIKTVSSVTGIPEDKLRMIYETFSSTGVADKAGTIMYALGWTQHTVGVQNIRSSCLIQLLLGNIGVAGGGINALRGEPNVQGSTDHTLLYHLLPGYHAMPRADWPTLDDYMKANTPVAHDPKSVNWWQHRPKYVVSLFKSWYGDAATKENGFAYDWLPKLDPGQDCSYMYIFDRMYKGEIKGGYIFGLNPMNSVPNTNKVRKALDNLDWLVTAELHHSETTDNWRRPGVDPKTIKTECFLLPSAHRLEKPGSVTNSGRMAQWHYQVVKPQGEAKNFGEMTVDIFSRVQKLYKDKGGKFPEPIVNMVWPETFDAEQICKEINGFFTKDTKVGDKTYKKGQLVPGFPALKDDGSTSSRNWLYTGSITEEKGDLIKRRDASQTEMQANIALYPNWGFAWPLNRRIIYNRASVDPQGKPWNPKKAVIEWTGDKWVGDVPDGGYPPFALEGGKHPFIMTTQGRGAFFGPGRMDGPFPEHYEPVETPLAKHPFSNQLHSPVYKKVDNEADPIANPADPKFPYVLTTYSLTEHWCGGGETRNIPNLLETEPQLYVEMSHQLAEEKGINNGEGVIVESIRGKVEAIAMVTVRIQPFQVEGKTVHLVGMPFAFGWTTPGVGDSTNRLTPSVGDPNTSIPEYKASCVNVYKADKLQEIEL